MNDYNLYNKKIDKAESLTFKKEPSEAKGDDMKKAIGQLKHLAELGGVPEYGNYNAISAEFKNDDEKLNASDVVLSVAPSILKERPKERELQIKVYSKDRSYSYSVTLFRGEKAEILKELEDENLENKIKKFIVESSDKFNEK